MTALIVTGDVPSDDQGSHLDDLTIFVITIGQALFAITAVYADFCV